MANQTKTANPQAEPNEAERARDLLAPVEHITLDGVTYPLTFSNQAMRTAEDVYELRFGKDVGFGEILKAIAKGKYAAIMALFYGALTAGGATIAWEEYDRKFKLDSVDGIRGILLRGMNAALPKEKGGTDPKNP